MKSYFAVDFGNVCPNCGCQLIVREYQEIQYPLGSFCYHLEFYSCRDMLDHYNKIYPAKKMEPYNSGKEYPFQLTIKNIREYEGSEVECIKDIHTGLYHFYLKGYYLLYCTWGDFVCSVGDRDKHWMDSQANKKEIDYLLKLSERPLSALTSYQNMNQISIVVLIIFPAAPQLSPVKKN